ncbi:MAG: DNA-binding domain-containing protein, partial [Acidobacteriota bacterium]|nr:DNA-binding domain-containing protein [Acidobacteriota bacterium]
ETQRKMAAALMLPLTSGDHIARKTKSGISMAQEAAKFIKPNDRLTSLERLEIYSRSYWFRLLDALRDDFPGLAAVLGSNAFERLARAYLSDCPSQSFTLRDLGSRLESWLRAHPDHAGGNADLALDMVRLEWAHIVAFDGPAEKILGPEDLIELTPALRLGVQPYIGLLELHYPVDELRIRVNANPEGSATASNIALKKRRRSLRQECRLQPERIFLAVHRLELSVYYRRLSAEEYRLLEALRAGRSVGSAIKLAFRGGVVTDDDIPGLLRVWFTAWAEFGWLSAPRRARRGLPS